MKKRTTWGWKALTFFLCSASVAATAQTLQTLVDFDFSNGWEPALASLVQGNDGSLYGTTSGGVSGGEGLGTIFKMTREGTITTLHHFQRSDGALPQGTLVSAADGSFYGTTTYGGDLNCNPLKGCGTVFRITPEGAFTTVHTFESTDGAFPAGGLVFGTDGSLYGTTGGDSIFTCVIGGCGTVFKLKDGVLTTLYWFCSQPNCSDGADPLSGLALGTDANLYGTTWGGGTVSTNCSLGCGTVFRVTPEGVLTTLHRFDFTDGTHPFGTPLQALDGSLYGTTSSGGKNGNVGTIFRIGLNGEMKTLYTFCSRAHCSDGYGVDGGLVQGTDGGIYGTTVLGGDSNCGCGTIFKLIPDHLETLHRFRGTDGANPYGGLFQGTDGLFYGTTTFGGSDGGGGTIFSLDVSLGPFVTFVRFAGEVGQTGPILGQGLTGTTSVSINGIEAKFTVVSDTYIRATVPEGATTGFVKVVTPSGVLKSNVPFHVIH